ncbi:DUF2993 domain-containing protein [Streptomyces sp. AK02-01A]|uniref:LmeA family phospholipid-binding protein n=1 Tax=Streptomyces sp. AK02-01A TaxID=3028648 RepID=UPI0029B441AB|nr:DUF2993 domain-containing protein [Streptomyces sp. AK02-01A]MDX3853261.1 DUF2993 domain-containing protein [Streptomyces sp. AK02-01A]
MRALRILLILVIVFGGLFVAADRAAVYFAEGQVADKIKSSQGLSTDPKVSIKGFPFLTQILGSSLDEVDISLDGVSASADGHNVEVTDVQAELKDVTINSSFSSATAARANGSAHISYADLAKSAPKGATVGYAGAERAAKGQVKLSGSLTDVLEGAGIEVPDTVRALLNGQNVTAYSTVSLESGNTVRLRAESLPQLAVPGLNDQVRDVVNYDLKIDGIPSTIKLDKVVAAEDGLRFSGTGTNISVAG